DGCLPSDMATGSTAEIDEERRLLYVAMTRARHHLHLLVPQRFYVTQQAAYGDRHVYASISRFLPESIRDRFAHCGPVAPGVVSAALPALPSTETCDLGARLRSAWR
ncbi:MAG: 3'-5' exonuclease, partial [Caldimonas sp.]